MITFIESGNRIATENFEIGEIYTITFTNGNYKTMCCVGIGSDFVMFQDKLPNALFCLTLGTAETVSSIDIGGGGGITMNYNELENKPQINGIVLIGNKTSSDLGLLSQADLDNYVTDTELTTELADYATNASVVSALASKQDTLTTPQLTAVNSGITSSLVTQIGTNTNAIAGKQDTLTTPQLTAVNSGITSSLVNQIGTNTTAIAGKQDTLTTPQLTAVNSGITSSLVNQITTNQNNISLIKQVPNVNSGDNGKVLTAGSSSYSWTMPTITGVKGGQESAYRTGKVSISAANILSTAQQNAVNSGVTSSTVSQVATNTTNIAWTKKTLQFSATAANTYEYTGLSIACPSNTLMEIWAIDDNSNSRITAIAVTDRNTSIDAVGSVIGENAEPLSMEEGAQWAREVHCVTPRLYGSARNYYVWVKRGSTGANNVTVLTRKIVTQ